MVTLVRHVFMLLVSNLWVALSAYAAVLKGHRATLCLHISLEDFWQFFNMTGCHRCSLGFLLPSVHRSRIVKLEN